MPEFTFIYNFLPESPFCDAEKLNNSNRITGFGKDKFCNDTVWIDDQDKLLILNGVVLNNNGINTGEDAIWCLYQEKGKEFFNSFRGSFNGVVYDKKHDKCVFFNDHIGSKNLFYYTEKSFLVVSTRITSIYDILKQNSITNDLNIDAAYMLLSYGYMLGENTLSKKINRLAPGHYIEIEKKQFQISKYYTLPVSTLEQYSLNEDDIIECLDDKFREAVKLQFEKDKEYGYNHFVALSGGLDSRMTSWVAHELGYKDQVNFTFSQSGYLDEIIAKEIASDLHHEWLFKALDNGLFLKDIDQITSLSGGGVLYYGLAHNNSLLKYVNFSELGIIHSGQLGDVIVGSFINTLDNNNIVRQTGAYSSRLLPKISTKTELPDDLCALENSLLYRRGFNGANSGLIISQNYSETLSPFYHIDFMEYCLSIPIKMRMGHSLYKKWISKKYPSAGNYRWEKTGRKINSSIPSIKYRNHQIPLDKVFGLVLNKLGLRDFSKKPLYSMNPLDFWYNTNRDLKIFMDNYFQQNIYLLDRERELKDDCVQMYEKGKMVEKIQVVTLLSAVKSYFTN